MKKYLLRIASFLLISGSVNWTKHTDCNIFCNKEYQEYHLSLSTKILVKKQTKDTFFKDEKGQKTNLKIKVNSVYIMSDFTAILEFSSSKIAYFFDAVKLHEPNKGLINLGKKINNFYKLSNIVGIFKDDNNQHFNFNASKVNQPSRGFSRSS